MEYPQRNTVDLDESLLFGCASLLDQVDKKVMVVLLDNRMFIGILRSVDQFNNLTLQDSVERICIGKQYGDIERGLFIVRGDSMALVGEFDPRKEEAHNLTKVPVEVILDAQRQEDEKRVAKGERLIKACKVRGLSYQNDQYIGDDI